MTLMKKIVIKIGSGTLLTNRGKFDTFRIAHIVEQVKGLVRKDAPQGVSHGVLIVTSGAVACGVEKVPCRGDAETTRRAAAGVGQVALMTAFSHACAVKGLQAAQVLITPHTLDTKDHEERLCKVLEHYFASGIVPIINENDVVQLNGFGGNDPLAARLAILIKADRVLFLSQMEPSTHGVGGGESKRAALKVLEEKGILARIVCGKEKDVIYKNSIENI
jgi:glutamate 5-kinase